MDSNLSLDTPKIYVACLAAYNNGFLHGRWVSLELSLDEIYQEINDMLKESPIDDAEEYEIHDIDDVYGVFDGRYPRIRGKTSKGKIVIPLRSSLPAA